MKRRSFLFTLVALILAPARRLGRRFRRIRRLDPARITGGWHLAG